VVVAEPFAEAGMAVLRRAGIDVVQMAGASRATLADALSDADGLIVRSETRVDRELLRCGARLAVVARAGAGVDAIDVDAATEAGIVVLNTPGANTLAAAEHTFALILSLCRNVPQAVADIREGRWDRRHLIGSELAEKTLGIVGLGRIGGAVAQRAKAFGMRVVATDPFVSAARADSVGARLVTLDELLESSDIVTLHVPLGPQTSGLIGAAQLARLRPHALLVNCARGGLVDEEALLKALDRHALRGAALDVVAEEPPSPESASARLHRHPKVIATPHIGGSTREALERVATEVATDVVNVLRGAPPVAAVNAPALAGPGAGILQPFVQLAYRLGVLLPQISTSQNRATYVLTLEGHIAEMEASPLEAAFLSGFLQGISDRRVSMVNARAIARELGIVIDVQRSSDAGAFASRLRVAGEATTLAGTSTNAGLRLLEWNGYEIDAVPAGDLVVTLHRDVPGMVGKVGTILGDAHINISTMQVSRNAFAGEAAMVLSVDRTVNAATAKDLGCIEGVQFVRTLRLPAAS